MRFWFRGGSLVVDAGQDFDSVWRCTGGSPSPSHVLPYTCWGLKPAVGRGGSGCPYPEAHGVAGASPSPPACLRMSGLQASSPLPLYNCAWPYKHRAYGFNLWLKGGGGRHDPCACSNGRGVPPSPPAWLRARVSTAPSPLAPLQQCTHAWIWKVTLRMAFETNFLSACYWLYAC